MAENELKPCPCCGNAGDVRENEYKYWVECQNCGLKSGGDIEREDVVEFWNSRSIQPDGDEVVISKQSLKDLLFLAKDYTSRDHYSQDAYDKFAAAVAEAKEKLGVK